MCTCALVDVSLCASVDTFVFDIQCIKSFIGRYGDLLACIFNLLLLVDLSIDCRTPLQQELLMSHESIEVTQSQTISQLRNKRQFDICNVILYYTL